MVEVFLKQLFTGFLIVFLNIVLLGQTGAIKGVVIDKKTKETIIGANVVISGTTIGKSTDLNGEFVIDKLQPGKYTLKISFISYITTEIKDLKVDANKTTNIKVEIEEKSTSLEGVTVVERKKTDTEISIMSSIKQSNLVVSGVSSQQIAKSQDKDASEVIRRIPGITIIDGRFVVVRGLIERYNSVWLNNAATPSSESDTRAFSFDVVPSNMIDRLMVYKTPAPELPADFAGASVQIFTKNIPDQNSLTIGYSAGVLSGTTFDDFYHYKGGKTDWLGFDDGTRDLPESFPSTDEFNKLGNFNGTPEQIAAQKAEITRLGRLFNKTWTADKMKAPVNNSFTIGMTRKFKVSGAEIGTIASLNYGNSFDYNSVYKNGYISYDTIMDKPSFSYKFNDEEYSNNVKLGALLNWSILINKNHSFEFRNILNQYGNTKTILRSGKEYYYSADGVPIKASDLGYTSRTTYSGQFGGQHKIFEQKTSFDWTLGFSYANKKQPDNRRTFATYYDAEGDTTHPNYGKYALAITKDANTDYNGRLFKDMFEKIYIAGLNISQKTSFLGIDPEFKAGIYFETKKREFNARNIGFTMAKSSSFNIDLFQSLDEIYKDTNINYTNGLRVDEKTNPSDSYKAENEILAYYLGMKLPVYALFNIYAGFRVENNKQVLNGFNNKTNLPLDITNITTDFFPSVNITYTITEKSLIRFAYGLTVNRPEFREIAPYSYYDFALKSTVYGNDSLKNAYVQNLDLRYEVYPSPTEMLNMGIFYKKFENPIEATLFPTSGSGGWDYLFVNTQSSTSLGAEIDIRKSFSKFATSTNFLKNLKYFTFTLNASYIYSKIVSGASYVRDKERPMQGQSPFIINTGIYFQNEKGLMVSALYNVIGKRIMYVGNPNSPHIFEMPFHLLDLSVNKSINNRLTVKFGVKNLLDDKVIFKQTVTFNKDTNNDGIGDGEVEREQITKEYKPGRFFSFGFSYQF